MSTHDCPISDCTRQVPRHQLMCSRHWRQVPRELQQRVYREYRQGTLADHVEACDAAVHAVEVRQ